VELQEFEKPQKLKSVRTVFSERGLHISALSQQLWILMVYQPQVRLCFWYLYSMVS